MPLLFKIGNINFYTYGLFLVIAISLSGYLMHRHARKQGKNKDVIFDFIIFPLLAGLIAAKITYYYMYLQEYGSFSDIIISWHGGMVSWGGFVAAIVVLLIVAKRYKEPPLYWLDLYSIYSLLGLSIGRLGSFISGEYAGSPTNSILQIKGVHPVTLYESILLLMLFIVFITIYNKKGHKKNGSYFVSMLLLYSIVRFFMDIFRTDTKYLWGLSLTQIITTVIIIGTILFLSGRLFFRKGVKNVG